LDLAELVAGAELVLDALDVKLDLDDELVSFLIDVDMVLDVLVVSSSSGDEDMRQFPFR
jgi:hypothetical protein